MRLSSKKSLPLLVIGLTSFFNLPSATAHHSFAPHFDSSKPVFISGVVIKFEARNPHAYVHVEAEDENGLKQTYRCESHGVTMLERNGINRDTLSPGQEISVRGSQHRRNPLMCFFDSVELADGTVLNVNGGNRASARATEVARAAAENAEVRSDIFGTWLLAPARRSTSGFQPMIELLTPMGEAATAQYDPFTDDPTFQCNPVAIRRAWFAPGTPMSISQDSDDNLIIRHEWMDVERTVHMNDAVMPDNMPASTLGYSIGHFEGGSLVVETAHYSNGVLRQYVEQEGQATRGLLHSDALTTIERISFDADKQLFTLTIEQSDPKYFSQGFPPVSANYAVTDLELKPFGCTPEVLD